MGFLRSLQARWLVVWRKPAVRMAYIWIGTALGVGIFYYPIVRKMLYPEGYTPEQLAQYDKENMYPIKVRKQREQEAKERRLAAMEAFRDNQEKTTEKQ